MIDKQKLLLEFHTEFQKLQKELKFKSTFQQLEDIFFLNDMILKTGFVSSKLSRQLSSRIVDLFNSWAWYLHGLILPNPQNMLQITEAEMFSDEEKRDFNELMKQAMIFSSRNSFIGLSKDKKEEAKFIDDSVVFWNEKLLPKLLVIMKKVNVKWKEEKIF